MMKNARSTFLVVVLLAASALAYSGAFFQTGRQWYDTCWSAKNAKEGPRNADEASSWGKCNYVAENSFYDAGFILGGDRDESITRPFKSISSSCPSSYSDVPMSGIDTLAIDLITQHGGANFIDNFLPARYIIERAFLRRWPNCPSARIAGNFPKMVESSGGFSWDSECVPCRGESSAHEEIKRKVTLNAKLNTNDSSIERLLKQAEFEANLRNSWDADHKNGLDATEK